MEQRDYFDDLVPTFNEKPHTRKVNAVNQDFFKLERKKKIQWNTTTPEASPFILFYLPSMNEPLELRNTAVITLGRSDKYSGFTPTVDTSEHHGALLGVSRHHAQIVYRDGYYYVSDLGSTNGTWVNDTRVSLGSEVQLAAGDTLRLGHLMIHIGGCGKAS
jgi:pSer/pThr/pTyr-binding forkhead associated (FHA) protein